MEPSSLQRTQQALVRIDQGHVARALDQLEGTRRDTLYQQLLALDIPATTHFAHTQAFDHNVAPPILPQLTASELKALHALGASTVREGRCACLTVAGGQGTRLGWHGPKGTLPVTPIKNKTLFHLFAEKILALQRRYNVVIPWLIMTSEDNHEATVRYFDDNQNFGLSWVRFFQQGFVPVLDTAYHWLLNDDQTLVTAADGHGGVFQALLKSGFLEDLRAYNINTLFYFQIDNPLVKCLDEAFVGLHVREAAAFSSATVDRVSAEEKVGLFALCDHQLRVIEYTDLPPALGTASDINGQLRWRAANIAVHCIDLAFARKMALQPLPLHVVTKNITVNGVKRECLKLERFVFDCMPFAKKTSIFHYPREAVFSPIKNLNGDHTVTTAQASMMRQWRAWYDKTGLKCNKIEISPLFADNEDTFMTNWKKLAQLPVNVENVYIG